VSLVLRNGGRPKKMISLFLGRPFYFDPRPVFARLFPQKRRQIFILE
jgi:hypothetical protein